MGKKRKKNKKLWQKTRAHIRLEQENKLRAQTIPNKKKNQGPNQGEWT